MNRPSAPVLWLVLVLAFAGALFFRLPALETRPLHNDEAVNAVKVAELWQDGRYIYDPDEYHGPTLHYFTLPFLWFSGATTANDLPDRALRLAPVFFGAALILLLPLFKTGLGAQAILWSALFIAISPAMVFYSRYFIHEMLLIFFTTLAIGAGWRYTQTRSRLWAVTTGAALGLMFATKETFVLSLAAMGIALAAQWRLRAKGSADFQSAVSQVSNLHQDPPAPATIRRLLNSIPWRDSALACAACLVVWLLFFSSFFTNYAGLIDSVLTYFPWLKRASGHSPHIHPWHFYFERLAWFHAAKGPVWSEALILALSVIGAIAAFSAKASPFARFLVIYSIVLAAIYTAISYKTPWCLLNFYLGLILLAGFGAATLIDRFRALPARIALAAVLLAASAQLGIQAWRASFTYAADRRNPYVYAQTVPDILNLVHRAEGLAKSSPDGYQTVIKTIVPESDYWPLPWHLRRFQHIGWYDQLPEDPWAPIIIAAADLDARLDDKSNRKWIMAGVTELRPGKFLELYVEIGLWTKYVQTLPPDPD